MVVSQQLLLSCLIDLAVSAVAYPGNTSDGSRDDRRFEMHRKMVSESAIARALNSLEVLNARIPGLRVAFEDDDEYNDLLRKLEKPPAAGKGIDSDADGQHHHNRSAMWAAARSSALQAKRASIVVQGPEKGWLEVSAAMQEDFAESGWFRLSLGLLAEIGKDRNAYSQRIVGCILPAECLLSIMEVFCID